MDNQLVNVQLLVYYSSNLHSVPEKKQPLCFLVIASGNINRFSKFFHQQIPEETDWVAMMAISTSA